MPPRLAELVRRARNLASERDRLVRELADEWVVALRGRGLSPTDLDELWAGITEEIVRRLGRSRRFSPETLRIEAADVIAKVRERVERALGDG